MYRVQGIQEDEGDWPLAPRCQMTDNGSSPYVLKSIGALDEGILKVTCRF